MENNNAKQRPRTWRIHGCSDFSMFMIAYPDLVTERIVNAKPSHKTPSDRVFWLLNDDGEVKKAYEALFGTSYHKPSDAHKALTDHLNYNVGTETEIEHYSD